MEYRLICWIIINIVGIRFVLRYAKRIKLHPERSPVYKEDKYWRKKGSTEWETMAPFSDLVDISRQATVIVYQFGDGFTNMITPTSGVLIGVLGIARIPYEKWVKWITPFMIILLILGFLLLIPTVTMNMKGF